MNNSSSNFNPWFPLNTYATSLASSTTGQQISLDSAVVFWDAPLPRSYIPVSSFQLLEEDFSALQTLYEIDAYNTFLALGGAGGLNDAMRALEVVDYYYNQALTKISYVPLSGANFGFAVGDKFQQHVWEMNDIGVDTVELSQISRLKRIYITHGKIIKYINTNGSKYIDVGIGNRSSDVDVAFTISVVKGSISYGLSVSQIDSRGYLKINSIDESSNNIQSGDFFVVNGNPICLNDPYLISGLFWGRENDVSTLIGPCSSYNLFVTSQNAPYCGSVRSRGIYEKQTKNEKNEYVYASTEVGESITVKGDYIWNFYSFQPSGQDVPFIASPGDSSALSNKDILEVETINDAGEPVINMSIMDSFAFSQSQYSKDSTAYGETVRLSLITLNFDNWKAGCLVGEYLFVNGDYFEIKAHVRWDIVDVSLNGVNGGKLNLSNLGKMEIINQKAWMLCEHYDALRIIDENNETVSTELNRGFFKTKNSDVFLQAKTCKISNYLVSLAASFASSSFDNLRNFSSISFIDRYMKDFQGNIVKAYKKNEGWALVVGSKYYDIDTIIFTSNGTVNGLYSYSADISLTDEISSDVIKSVESSVIYICFQNPYARTDVEYSNQFGSLAASGSYPGVAGLAQSIIGNIVFGGGFSVAQTELHLANGAVMQLYTPNHVGESFSGWLTDVINVNNQGLFEADSATRVSFCGNYNYGYPTDVFASQPQWSSKPFTNRIPVVSITTDAGLRNIYALSSYYNHLFNEEGVVFVDKATNLVTLRGGSVDFSELPRKSEIIVGDMKGESFTSLTDTSYDRLHRLYFDSYNQNKSLFFIKIDEDNYYGSFIPKLGKTQLSSSNVASEIFTWNGDYVSPIFVNGYSVDVCLETKNESGSGYNITISGSGNSIKPNSASYCYDYQTLKSTFFDIIILSDNTMIIIFDREFGEVVFNGKTYNSEELKNKWVIEKSIMAIGSKNNGGKWGLPYQTKDSSVDDRPVMLLSASEYMSYIYDKTSESVSIFFKSYIESKYYIGLLTTSLANFNIDSNVQGENITPDNGLSNDKFLVKSPNVSDSELWTDSKNAIINNENTFKTQDRIIKIVGEEGVGCQIVENNNIDIVSAYILGDGTYILLYNSNGDIKAICSFNSGLSWVDKGIFVARGANCSCIVGDCLFYTVNQDLIVKLTNSSFWLNLKIVFSDSTYGDAIYVSALQNKFDTADTITICSGIKRNQRIHGSLNVDGTIKIYYYDDNGSVGSVTSKNRVNWYFSDNF